MLRAAAVLRLHSIRPNAASQKSSRAGRRKQVRPRAESPLPHRVSGSEPPPYPPADPASPGSKLHRLASHRAAIRFVKRGVNFLPAGESAIAFVQDSEPRALAAKPSSAYPASAFAVQPH